MDCNPNWKDREKDKYVSPLEIHHSKDLEGGRFEEKLLRILNKDKGSDKMLKVMKEDMSTLRKTITSH